MNLNITNLYKEYEDGKDFDRVVNGAAEVAENALSNKPDFNLDAISNYDMMKDKLAIEVVSAERNKGMMSLKDEKLYDAVEI